MGFAVTEIELPRGTEDPYPLFRELTRGFKTTFYLDSYNAGALGRYSYFPLTEPKRIFFARDAAGFKKSWTGLQAALEKTPPIRSRPSAASRLRAAVPFPGGAVGLLSYDCGRVFERGWKSKAPADKLRFPWMSFGLYGDLFCFDHRGGRAFLVGSGEGIGRSSEKIASALRRLAPSKNPVAPPRGQRRNFRPAASVAPGRSERFQKSVRKIQDYIAAGDIYQANFSQRLEFPYKGSGLDYFANLRQVNPSPYAFYYRTGDFEVVSCSPELLLKKRGDRLETRPIAGTRPRGENRAADRRLEGELLLNAKERAEHVMLLDLERNDLSRVCRAGTVRVSEKMIVEKYSHVMHIVSCVQGRMKKGADAFRAVEAVFPGGTITGCPKVRSMEILDEMEPARRGPFYGSFGWIGWDGDCEMNLMIRTAILSRSQRKLAIQVGSGIVADSDPAREYDESLHKARALLSAANTARKF